MVPSGRPVGRVEAVDELTGLLLAARAGDRDALRGVVERTQAEVWSFLAHQVGPADVDDVTQDTYVRMWRALPAFRHEARARTWLLAIARRAAVDALRRRGRRTRLAERAGAARPGLGAPDPAAGHAVEELVAGLPDDRREAFVLTQLLGCSYEEAAAVCRVPVGTIRSRVARARAQLVEQLRDAETG